MDTVLFLFLLIGAPFFWVAIYSFFKKKDDDVLKEGIYLSLYTMAFMFLLFTTQSPVG